MNLRDERFGRSVACTLLAVLGLTFAEVARKVHFYSAVKPQIDDQLLYLTVAQGITISISQLITVVALFLISLWLVHSHNRTGLFHPAILFILATIILVTYLSELDISGTQTTGFLRAGQECIKVVGYIIALAWAKELFESEGDRVVIIAALSFVLSGLLEIVFAFMSYTHLLAFCMATPIYSLVLLYLYRYLLSAQKPLIASMHPASSPEPAVRQPPLPLDHPRQLFRSRTLWICALVFIAFGAIRSLSHQNIDIAQHLQNGAVLSQIFDASGSILAGTLIVIIERNVSREGRVSLYASGALIGFVLGAFVYLSAQNFALASVLTTFSDTAYRLVLILMWILPLTLAARTQRISLYTILLTAFQCGVLVGGTFLNSNTVQFVIMLVCFVFLLIVILRQAAAQIRQGSPVGENTAARQDSLSDADQRSDETAAEQTTPGSAYKSILLVLYISEQYELTQRETEILSLLLKGYSPRQIADEFVISYDTAKTHRRNIFKKLDVASPEELTAKVADIESHEFEEFLKTLSS